MHFREWLELDEARFKGLKRMFQQQFPGMPQYVANDLYNTRIGYTMNKMLGQGEKQTSNITGVDTHPIHPLSGSGPSEIFKNSGLKDVAWVGPEVLKGKGNQEGVTPNDFTQRTRWYFINRRFGYVEVPVRDDAARTRKQKELMTMRMGGRNEPVIVIQTMEGYELLEGWHRTMNYLLSGAPKDQIEVLQNGYISDLNFDLWKPVLLKAYIGRGPRVQAAMAGTGVYQPGGTGEYVPQNGGTAEYIPQ